jgi:HSP20 family protein
VQASRSSARALPGRILAVIDPSQQFADIYDRMGALVNAALGDAGPAWLAEMPWSPLADVSETDEAYIIRIDLPGVRKDQIDVQLQDRELAVTGEVDSQPAGRRRRSTRRTGRFEYRTVLPGDVQADRVSAQLSDGVLTLTVPKSEAPRPQHIEVSG